MAVDKYVLFIAVLFIGLQGTLQEQTIINRDGEFTTDSIVEITKPKRIIPIMFRRASPEESTCVNSEDDFPSFLTPEQRRNGGVIIAFLVGIYCFTLLAIICDKYFLPCVERICEALNVSQDVAAATFMAMATSAPELFVNIIGTFITGSDIGIGTVTGSSLFNCLGVAALGSLAASQPIKLDWWPVTRDTVIYITSISLLVVITWDGMIYWYEGMLLFIVYFLYFVVMFNNKRISKHVRRFVSEHCANTSTVSTENIVTEKSEEAKRNTLKTPVYILDESLNCYVDVQDILKSSWNENNNKSIENCEQCTKPVVCNLNDSIPCKELEQAKSDKENVSDWSKMTTIPQGKWHKKLFFFYLWPIKCLLFCIIPNPKTFPKLFPLTFVMCIISIGLNSYVISWMITIIGHTFSISDTLMGLTLLAAGGCLPEATSIVIMSRKGEGSMGVSNALGGNTMNILMSLGLPWFIKTLILKTEHQGSNIEIVSGSIEYTILGLMLVAMVLFLVLFFNKFYLRRRTGVILIITYVIFLSGAIALEVTSVAPC